MKDKYLGTWVSHSSIKDFLNCKRVYYLNNVYKNPRTGHKITLMQPALALGQAVHAVIESLSIIPTQKRFTVSLLEIYEKNWTKVTGKLGGFSSFEQEKKFKERGAAMLRRIIQSPGPLKNKAVKINMNLPHYWLSEEDNIILCGKIDWIEYLEETDSIGIIDFKTGKYEEKTDSLQLAIYFLLAENCQKRKISRARYWYLDINNEPTEIMLPNAEEAKIQILKIAKKIKLHRQLGHFKCNFSGGCKACLPFEKIIQGYGEFVGINDFNQDIYVVSDTIPSKKDESTIL